jgi:peroxiredoxin/tRNA A-37 threonylcarbamoyl transferase component Bud32
MPILLQCSCGKKLRLADAHAGKRVRCPECGGVCDSPPAADPPPVEAPRPGIRVRCACGKTLEVRADLAGKTVRCPGCKEKVAIPMPTRADPAPKTQPADGATLDFAPAGRAEPPTLDAVAADEPEPSERTEARTRAWDGPPAVGSRFSRHFGDYELLEEIARGGMGVVFKARQKSPARIVALKMILAGNLASAEQIRRFHVETEEAGRLDHPNIVPIYQVGEHEGQHYFTMKFIEGGSLSEEVKRFSKSFRKAAQLVATLARAVHHAHQRGILHRDIKPGNILIDEDGQPHVTDFGLAKHLGEKGNTQSGAVLGTPGYMAPEQAAGHSDLTVAVDVHGLGAVLYELLGGEPPFQAETTFEAILQVMERDPAPVRAHNPKVPVDLETICLTCLHKEPGHRYPGAAELADDLERFLSGEPIHARPVGRLERAAKWARRRPAVAALVAVTALAAVALTVGGWWFTVRLRSALAASEQHRKEAESNETLARQESQRAEAAFQKGVQSIDDMLLNLDGRLARKSGMDPVRIEFLREFLGFSQQLNRDRPNDPAARRQLGRIWARLGELWWQGGHHAQAEQALLQAIEIQNGLVAEFPTRQQYRQELAATHSRHARLLLARKDYPAARAALERAFTVADQLARQGPTQPEHRQLATRLRFQQADVVEEAGQHAEARKLYEEVLAQQEKLVADLADHPTAAQAHHFLGYVADSLAALLAPSDPARGQQLLVRAVDAQRQAWLLSRRTAFADDYRAAYSELARHLHRHGRHAELAKLAGQLADDAPDARIDTYNAACLMANAADAVGASALPGEQKQRLRAGYGEQAVKLLSKAVQAGYASTQEAREHMDRDSDLDPLRRRDDYKALLARIDQGMPARSQTPAQRYAALVKEHTSAVSGYRRALAGAETLAQRRRVQAQAPDVSRFAGRFLDLAEKEPVSPSALDALTWVLKNAQVTARTPRATASALGKVRRRAFQILQRDQLSRPELTNVCWSLAAAAEPEGNELLAEIVKNHREPRTRGIAAYALALSLNLQAQRCQRSNPVRARSLTVQAEQHLQEVVDKFPKVPLGNTTLGNLAGRKLVEVKHLSVGSKAQEVSGADLDGRALKLSDYRGKVVVLDFWANWCGYCRMEYAFQRDMVKRLAGKPFVLLGINADEDRGVVQQVVQRHGLNWRSWYDGPRGPIQGQWQVNAFPTVYVIDHRGVVRYKGLRNVKLEAAVKQLLAEQAAERTKT